ncbi:WhiB family transcriptional regulator [Paeniglutamicibacter sp.]|uniref:WhiB family transcriptional regulator n=1 Tax=Paeniglutamicibacter sp. TaxID=1934391 RepID=UPI00398942E3
MSGHTLPCRGGQEWQPDASPADQAIAVKLCGSCGLKPECLSFALASNQTSGVWGGTRPQDRRRIRREAKGDAA